MIQNDIIKSMTYATQQLILNEINWPNILL